MKTRWKIAAGLATLGVAGVVFLVHPGNGAQAAEQARSELRKAGFKTDLSDFDVAPSEKMDDRIAALGLENRTVRFGGSALFNSGELMMPAGEHGAVVIWKQNKLTSPNSQYGPDEAANLWPIMRDQLDEERLQLDRAARAVLSGPIRFHLNLASGGATLLPHLAGVRRLGDKFGSRAIMALHYKDTDTAWTNLLAATRLVTAWDIEPVEISQYVRCYFVEVDYKLTWQALQAGDWPDERLAELQREWESLDLLKGLPDTVAFAGASDVAACRAERERPSAASSPLRNPFRSPRQAFDELIARWRERRYRSTGTYVDERDMLLFYRDRELEMRRAVQSPSWAEMRTLPGIAKPRFFESRYTNRFSIARSMRQAQRVAMSFQARGGGLIERAVEAEARRRLILTAIALERFRMRHGSYPKTLAELAPEFLRAAPMDFMDGKPLRYARTGDGNFFMYSVGLSCADNGGKMPAARSAREAAMERLRGGSTPTGEEIIWPQPVIAEPASTLR